jgi:hypothetical protein
MATTKIEASLRRSLRSKAAAETRKRRRKEKEKARDQFAALGRFIQSFENIVDLLRWHSERIMQGDHLGVTGPDLKVASQWKNITSLALHYDGVTAKTVLDVWRALLAEERTAMVSLEQLSKKGDEVAKGISGEIASEFSDIYQERNRLIHATWRIGNWSPLDESYELGVVKYRVGSEGFAKRTDLPGNFEELIECGARCDRLHKRLVRFLQWFHYLPKDLDRVFACDQAAAKGQKWKFISRARLPASREKSK